MDDPPSDELLSDELETTVELSGSSFPPIASTRTSGELDARFVGLELSTLPVWIFDPVAFRIVWANEAALALWHASSRAELYARDLSDMTEATRARVGRHLEQHRQGLSVKEEWTLYPRGVPETVTLVTQGVALEGGRQGVLLQAISVEGCPDPALLRGIEALRHTSVMVTLLDEDGKVLMHNPAAHDAFGWGVDFGDCFLESESLSGILRAARYGQLVRCELAVHTRQGERWHVLEARPTVDPVTGKRAVLVHQTDESARRGAQESALARALLIDELNATLELVEQQKQQILSLSAPILDVGHKMLAVPIIGPLDASRAAEIAARLLPVIVARQAERVVLDLTGVDASEAHCVDHLLGIARAIRLLGSLPVITGIPIAMALEMASAELDWKEVRILRSLSEALEVGRLGRRY